MFTPEQIRELEAPLNKAHVKSREQSGQKLSYIEGWWAIAEANRVFGFGSWDRETIDLKVVTEATGEKCRVGYMARVRITVLAGDKLITRDGCGFGSGIDKDMGRAHESALKEAETDAMKRALMTFGNIFGLALYDKAQANVADAPPVDPENCPAVTAAKVAIDMCGDLTALKRWHAENIAALEMLPGDQFDAVARHYKAKGAEFRAQQQKEAA
jgi:DNA recombination protein Rad52